MVIVNLMFGGFITRVREKLGKFDFDRLSELIQASSALADGLGFDLRRHINTLVNGLESDLNTQLFPGRNHHQTLTELLR